jgi:uncharacterized protein DUF2844
MEPHPTSLHRAGVTLLALCFGLGAPSTASATLGGDIGSVGENERALGAVRTMVTLSVGTRHDLALPSGGVVHEYVSPSGVVSAVTWQGPTAPNLRELLGAHFEDLARAPTHGGHHAVNLSLDDFELRSWNHGRSFGGRAWVPSRLPAGVRVEEWVE